MSKQPASPAGNRPLKDRSTKKLTINLQQPSANQTISLGKNSPQAAFSQKPRFPIGKVSRSKNLFQFNSNRNLRKVPIKLTPNPKALSSKQPRSFIKPKSPSSSIQSNKKKQLTSVVRQVTRSQKGKNQYKQHLFQTFQALKFVRTLREPQQREIAAKRISLPYRKGYEQKRTVVFDLDETLVHCVQRPQQGHVAINITFPSGDEISAGVNIRPFAREVLVSANMDYQVIVFTASHRCYADRVLDYIDPTGQLIHHRLYRENCLVIDGFHIKDLRVLGNRNIEDVVIIDNAAYSFAYQLPNGIPIISWYDDMGDKELFKLIDYLKLLARVESIRRVNLQTFRLDSFVEDYLTEIMGEGDKENIENQKWNFLQNLVEYLLNRYEQGVYYFLY